MTTPIRIAAATSLALVIGACASYTAIPKHTRVQLSVRHAGTTVELKQSHYYGDLYEENEKWLLSHYAFADTSHIVDLDNRPIHPKGQKGIIPAGTQFVIEKIEFPDMQAMAKRMLTTPRYNPWVYMKAVPEQAGVLTDRTYILLLPMDMKAEAEVEEALTRYLDKPGAVRAWLAQRKPTIRVAIEHKDVSEGMSVEELVASMGHPQRWLEDTMQEKSARVAWYTSKEIWLVSDTVVDVRTGRVIEQAPNEPVPAAGPKGGTPPPEAPSDDPSEAQPATGGEPDPAAEPEPAAEPKAAVEPAKS